MRRWPLKSLRLFETLRTYSTPLVTGSPSHGSGFTLAAAAVADLEALHAAAPDEFGAAKMETLSRRLTTSEKVWIIRTTSGQAVGWCCAVMAKGPNPRIYHTLSLASDEVFLFDDGVLSAARGRGAHAYAIAARLEWAHRAGARTAVTMISNRNATSIRSYSRMGFTPRSHVVFVRPMRRSFEIPILGT